MKNGGKVIVTELNGLAERNSESRMKRINRPGPGGPNFGVDYHVILASPEFSVKHQTDGEEIATRRHVSRRRLAD